jgi:hypothetical protein
MSIMKRSRVILTREPKARIIDTPWAVGEARALHVATGILKSPKVGLLLGDIE